MFSFFKKKKNEIPEPLLIKESDLSSFTSLSGGGEATIYKCTWHNQEVIVKQYTKPRQDDAELEILNKVTDAGALNIVKLHGYFLNKHLNKYPIMEYMKGGSLFEYIKNNTNKPFDNNIKEFVRLDMIQGLDFLHQLGYIHADVKSHNFVLDEKFRVKLCDFGMAFQIGKNISSVGSAWWAAPEMMKRITTASDIFSLMTCFWELEAWKQPFANFIFPLKLLKEVRRGLRETIPESCDPNVKKLIEWGWKENPDDRPTSKDVLNSLIQIRISESKRETEKDLNSKNELTPIGNFKKW